MDKVKKKYMLAEIPVRKKIIDQNNFVKKVTLIT